MYIISHDNKRPIIILCCLSFSYPLRAWISWEKYFVSTCHLFPFMLFVNFEKEKNMCLLSEQEILDPPDKTVINWSPM